MERAYRHLNGMDINGKKIKLEIVSIQAIYNNCFLGQYQKMLTCSCQLSVVKWLKVDSFIIDRSSSWKSLKMKPIDAARI